ncbi:hypothetical protein LY76DRAFT_322751 [Colletotrichum caudatum]|nr:hypothetical protein LY76DRAFT_322751 [Colletotrichum caudatum]
MSGPIPKGPGEHMLVSCIGGCGNSTVSLTVLGGVVMCFQAARPGRIRIIIVPWSDVAHRAPHSSCHRGSCDLERRSYPLSASGSLMLRSSDGYVHTGMRGVLFPGPAGSRRGDSIFPEPDGSGQVQSTITCTEAQTG